MKKSLTLLKTCLMVLTLSSCKTFPEIHPHTILVKKEQCIPCEVIDKEKLLFRCYPERVKPISECDGMIALPDQEVADVLSWARKNKNKCEMKGAEAPY